MDTTNLNNLRISNDFSEVLIKDAFKQHFEDSKIKLNPNANKVLCKVMKAVTEEACKRAVYEAMKTNATVVDVSHFEKIIAQLLLDIS
ncbi:UNVERIFIED_CONTAM: hypothetical protein RMT77_019092 [Armadillidium vulgare]